LKLTPPMPSPSQRRTGDHVCGLRLPCLYCNHSLDSDLAAVLDCDVVAAKSRRPAIPKPPETMNRFMKGLLAVPAEEIPEQKAIYARKKRQRLVQRASPSHKRPSAA